jgi:hypothetical protein
LTRQANNEDRKLDALESRLMKKVETYYKMFLEKTATKHMTKATQETKDPHIASHNPILV